MSNIGYQNRRYKVVMGKLEKSWKNPPPAGWFVQKSDAWAAYQEEIAEAKTFDEVLAAKKALRAAEAPPEIDPATTETPPANTGGSAKVVERPRVAITGTLTINPGDGATPEPEAPEPVAEAPGPEPAEIENTAPTSLAAELPPEPEPEGDQEPDLAAAEKVLRVSAVIKLTGLSRTTIFRRVKAGTFVAPLDLGNGHIGWRETLILNWLRDQPGASQAPEAAI